MKTHVVVTDDKSSQSHTFKSDLNGKLLKVFVFSVKVVAKMNGWEVVVIKKESDSQ